MKLRLKFNHDKKCTFAYLIISTSITLFCQSILAENQSHNVTLASFESLSFYSKNSAPAMVVAINQSNVPAEVRGVVDKIHVQVGQVVKQEQLLAELECLDIKINLVTENANLELLENQHSFQQREVERGLKLFERRNLGEAEFDSRKMELKSLEARLKAQSSKVTLAEINRAACFIRAPFSGVIVSRMISEGEMLERGAALLNMVQTDNLEVSAQIALSHHKSLQLAKDYAFQTKEQYYPLNFRSMVNVVVSNSLSLEARLTFAKELAITGMSGRLVWHSTLPYLPAHLLQKRKGHYGVFIEEAKQAKFILIANAQEGRPFSVVNEFWQGKNIIIDGRHGLINGQTLKIISLEKNKKETLLQSVSKNKALLGANQ